MAIAGIDQRVLLATLDENDVPEYVHTSDFASGGAGGAGGGLTDDELRASAVPVSLATAPLPTALADSPMAHTLDIVTLRVAYTAAQTDAAIVTANAGDRIIVTRCTTTADAANSVAVGVRIGFGAANTPTGAGVVQAHPGIVAGSGVVDGNGAGAIGVGADGEDLRITSEVPTGGSIEVVVTYYVL